MELNLNFINKIIKEKNGKIVFSYENTVIFHEEEIFQTIEKEYIKPSRDLELYIKKLKRFSKIDILIEDGYYKTAEFVILKDEVSEEKLETFVKYQVKELLNEEDIDEYFIKYFKKNNQDETYIVYILERDFIEDLVEFFLRNRLKAGRIILDRENNFCIDDYDILLKKNSSISVDKKSIIIMVVLILSFCILKTYNFTLTKKIKEIDKEIILSDTELNRIKLVSDELDTEVLELQEKLGNLSEEKEFFQKKIMEALKIIPESVRAENIYYEKGFLNIKGFSSEENSLFKFLMYLEKDKNILSAKYDYITKKDNYYEFFIEIKVQE